MTRRSDDSGYGEGEEVLTQGNSLYPLPINQSHYGDYGPVYASHVSHMQASENQKEPLSSGVAANKSEREKKAAARQKKGESLISILKT
jgi:hypothetical protein